MDWEHLSAGWSQYGDRVREQWSKLTDEDLAPSPAITTDSSTRFSSATAFNANRRSSSWSSGSKF
jgi:hypothetical protein